MEPTQFEALLKEQFPDVYHLHQLSKSEPHLWELLAGIQQMRAEDVTGRLEVFYTKGHIDAIKKTIDLLAWKGARPGY